MNELVRFVLAIGLAALLAACGPDVDHPAPDDALEAEGTAIGSVGGRPVTAEEVRLLKKQTGIDDPKQLRERLITRELLADAALEKGANPGIRHVRKRAMVRAMLADEIEAKVTADNVDSRIVEQVVPRMEAQLRGPSAEQAVGLFIGPRTRERKEAEEVADETRAAAEAAREWVMEDPSRERLLSFDVSSVGPPNGAKIERSLTVVDPAVARDSVPKGWVQNNALYQTLRAMEVGEVSPLLPLGFGYAILVREQPRSPDSDVTDEEVLRRARIKARDALRTTHLDRMLKELRRGADIEKNPSLIEQQHRQSP